MTSLIGVLALRRAYYHCPRCGAGQVPWDVTLSLGRRDLTAAAGEVVTLAGTLDSFAQAAERTLIKLAGLRLSESTVERTTAEAGARVGELLRGKTRFGADRKWAWQRDAQGRSCAYVSLDATGVRQQGPRGAKADGRMAYAAMIYNARSEHDDCRVLPHQVRYLAGFYHLDELGSQLRRQAAQVGWDDAEQQIAISDGGNGLEQFFEKNFPLAVCILDFYHASEHVTNLARTLHPSDEEAFQQQTHTWCRQLKHEGGGDPVGDARTTRAR